MRLRRAWTASGEERARTSDEDGEAAPTTAGGGAVSAGFPGDGGGECPRSRSGSGRGQRRSGTSGGEWGIGRRSGAIRVSVGWTRGLVGGGAGLAGLVAWWPSGPRPSWAGEIPFFCFIFHLLFIFFSVFFLTSNLF